MPPPGGFDGGMGGGMGPPPGPPGGGMPAPGYNPNMDQMPPAYPAADMNQPPQFQPGPPMDPQSQNGTGGAGGADDDDFAARLANLKNM